MAIALTLLSACGDPTGTSNTGPWLGEWVQVNFLATDDGGVWGGDDLSGIGFVANITETEWREADDFGAGCSLVMSYSVEGDLTFSRQGVAFSGAGCPAISASLLTESGRLEFSNGDTEMIEWFDLLPGDEIAAFKWVRR